MNCFNPIDPAILADYWLALLAQPEEDTVEEHLFACDECGTRLREIIGLADAILNIAREGSLRLIVSDFFLQSAAEQGFRIREYSLRAGGSVQCTVTAEDHFLVARLAANVTGSARIDLCLCDERGMEQGRLQDIPVHAGAPVIYHESIQWAKTLPDNRMIARLLSIDAAGREHLLGEYTFNHTLSLPGPGSTTQS